MISLFKRRGWRFVGLALLLTGSLALSLGNVWARPPDEPQTGGLEGVVTNLATAAPIAGARISAAGQEILSDAQGRYRLALPEGIYDVRAEASDFIGMTQTWQMVSAAYAALDFAMIPEAPSEAESAIIDERMRQLAQELPFEPDDEVRAKGYALSAVYEVPTTLRVLMPTGAVVEMAMDEYLKGVVPHEVPPSWPRESLRAQAVAARSYASTRFAHGDQGADVCTTTHCQVWRPTHYDTTDRAVNDTHGVVARYNGAIIYAFFFGHCDGHTRNSQDVWGGYLPYCQGGGLPVWLYYHVGARRGHVPGGRPRAGPAGAQLSEHPAALLPGCAGAVSFAGPSGQCDPIAAGRRHQHAVHLRGALPQHSRGRARRRPCDH
jgi:hypothetical protein